MIDAWIRRGRRGKLSRLDCVKIEPINGTVKIDAYDFDHSREQVVTLHLGAEQVEELKALFWAMGR